MWDRMGSMEFPKTPSPWLAPGISATALLAFSVWSYIQMLHWNDPGANYVPIAGNIIGTGLLVILLLVAIYVNVRDARRNRGIPGPRPAIQEVNPLVIVFARWGIGGSAYKDVTEIVRQHATSDGVSLPASIGVFGDPYPGAVKHLRVAYSVPRKWEVEVKENDYIKLPEKEGEEQARKWFESAKKTLAEMQRPEDKLMAGMSESEFNLFQLFRSDFTALPWCEKIALKRVCSITYCRESEMLSGLDGDGFKDPSTMIDHLALKGFLERTHDGLLKPQASKAKWIDVLFEGRTFC